MEILFISSGNTKSGISPIIKNQGQSLINLGHKVTFYTIKGKGLKGYFNNIFTLRRFLKNKNFDVIHAHYSLSAMVASLSGAQPLVASLMGSDVKASGLLKYMIRFFNRLFWKKVIVKSEDMKISAGLKESYIIPNGVDFEKFTPKDRNKSIEITQWDSSKKHILFAANPGRYEKNFVLAKQAFELLNDPSLELQVLIDIPNEKMVHYFNSADVILLTSLWEGSPNVIKEAMACNCKIVAVDVGDVKKVISNTQGCFVTSFNVKEIASTIKGALLLEYKTKGRNHIQYLNSSHIAQQIINIYNEILYSK
ncbi:glycosyltransferase family 4 protein [Aquimarina sp. 2201CG1-2-11]|uniref:glycosyltransferase family 4 protein n=1 Tax=Aquimarina discodermiae TaxID=3231043 RepID=UPI0034628E93